MQWTSHFFEVVIVASCNEYLSLTKKKEKKKKMSTLSLSRLAARLRVEATGLA